MRKKIETKKQILEALNNIDKKCIDEGLHFYDLKSLFESSSDRLTAQDRTVLKTLLNNNNTSAEDVMALMDSRLKEDIDDDVFGEPFDELYGDDAFMDDEPLEAKYKVSAYYEESLRGLEDDLNTNDYDEALDFVWDKCQEGLWVEVLNTETGNSEIYSPDKFDEDAIGPEDLKESLEDNEYDYYTVSDEYGVIGEYPTYEEARQNCNGSCQINGVIQYGANEYEETPLKTVEKDNIEESFDEEGFRDWLEKEYYPGFDPSSLSDEEYYELEDAYRKFLGESLNEGVEDTTKVPYSILFDCDVDYPLSDEEYRFDWEDNFFKEDFEWEIAYEKARSIIEDATIKVEEKYEGFEVDFGDYTKEGNSEFYDDGTLFIPNTYNVDDVVALFTNEIVKGERLIKDIECVIGKVPETRLDPAEPIYGYTDVTIYVEDAGVYNEN